MADDDRYRWLDGEAAERLLRGSSIDARHPGVPGVDARSAERARAVGPRASDRAEDAGGAERLAAVLDALARTAVVPEAPEGAREGREARGASSPEGDAAIAGEREQDGTRAGPGAREGHGEHGVRGEHGGREEHARADGRGRTDTARSSAHSERRGHPEIPEHRPLSELPELPGEAAALDAFRAAQAGSVQAGTGAPVSIAGLPADTGTVLGRQAAKRESAGAARDGREGREGHGGRTSRNTRDRDRAPGRRPGAARRVALVGRPLRTGFVMAVAGCALSGVAVAASVLPTPFGGGGSPTASVSPLASPDESDGEAAPGGGSRGPEGTPDTPGHDGDGHGGTSTGRGEGLADGSHGHGTGRKDGKPGAGPHGRHDGKGDGRHGRISESEKTVIARALCPAYEHKTLSLEDRTRLAHAAGGPEAVRLFCLRHGLGFNEHATASGSSAPGTGPGTGTPTPTDSPTSTGGSGTGTAGPGGGSSDSVAPSSAPPSSPPASLGSSPTATTPSS